MLTLDENSVLFDSLTLCPGDEDWFSVSVEAGQVLEVAATFVQSEGNVELAPNARRASRW